MEWYNYLAAFFAGAFMCNAVPHFVSGLCGNKFPTPFSKPPGRGLSSPVTNVLWAMLNILLGYLLFSVSHMNAENTAALILFFLGITAMGIMSALNFQKKEKE